jgi:hypothetical protein
MFQLTHPDYDQQPETGEPVTEPSILSMVSFGASALALPLGMAAAMCVGGFNGLGAGVMICAGLFLISPLFALGGLWRGESGGLAAFLFSAAPASFVVWCLL